MTDASLQRLHDAMVAAWRAIDRYLGDGGPDSLTWLVLDRLNDAADDATRAYVDAYVRHHAPGNTSGKRVRKTGKT